MSDNNKWESNSEGSEEIKKKKERDTKFNEANKKSRFRR